MKLAVGYPDLEQEQEILARRRKRKQDEVEIQTVASRDELNACRRGLEAVAVEPDIEAYIVQIVAETRRDRRVAVGASPRGSLAILKLARAWAAIDGRGYVLPVDVKSLAEPALIHRLILEPEFWTKRRAAQEILRSILQSVPVPVLEGI